MGHPAIPSSIFKLDLRGIARDQVAFATVSLSVVGTLAITALGLFGTRTGCSAWFPFAVAVTLVGSPGGYGFLFGMLIVEEGETGVRQALAVTPLPPTLLILTRTLIATTWTCAWPLASVYLMNSTWQQLDLSPGEWMAVVGPLALLAAAIALLIPTLSTDKLGALAVFKVLSFITLLPLALYVVPRNAWYRYLFLASPTGWTVETYRAFVTGNAAPGYRCALGGAAYSIALLAVTMHAFQRKIYGLAQ